MYFKPISAMIRPPFSCKSMGDTAAFSLYSNRNYSEPTNLTELSRSYFSGGRRKLTQGTSFGCLRRNKIQPCDAVKKTPG